MHRTIKRGRTILERRGVLPSPPSRGRRPRGGIKKTLILFGVGMAASAFGLTPAEAAEKAGIPTEIISAADQGSAILDLTDPIGFASQMVEQINSELQNLSEQLSTGEITKEEHDESLDKIHAPPSIPGGLF